MKTAAFVLLIFYFSLLACKREAPEKKWLGTLTAMVDSVQTTFPLQLKADEYYTSISKQHHIVIEGCDAAGENKIEIRTSDSVKNVIGRYCEDGSTNSKTARLIYERKGDRYWFNSYNSSQNPATITITVLEPGKIQGTFAGDVFLVDYVPPNFVPTSTKKVIKDGRFELRFE